VALDEQPQGWLPQASEIGSERSEFLVATRNPRVGAASRGEQPEQEGCVMPHSISDFMRFIGTDFEPDILPIIPAGALLKPDSSLSPEHLGRIPGKYLASVGAWVGFAGWLTHEADKYDLERWEGWQKPGVPVAVGLNTRRFHAFVIDTDRRYDRDLDHDVHGSFACGSPAPRQLQPRALLRTLSAHFANQKAPPRLQGRRR
jgi:hypothetical protein